MRFEMVEGRPNWARQPRRTPRQNERARGLSALLALPCLFLAAPTGCLSDIDLPPCPEDGNCGGSAMQAGQGSLAGDASASQFSSGGNASSSGNASNAGTGASSSHEG